MHGYNEAAIYFFRNGAPAEADVLAAASRKGKKRLREMMLDSGFDVNTRTENECNDLCSFVL